MPRFPLRKQGQMPRAANCKLRFWPPGASQSKMSVKSPQSHDATSWYRGNPGRWKQLSQGPRALAVNVAYGARKKTPPSVSSTFHPTHTRTRVHVHAYTHTHTGYAYTPLLQHFPLWNWFCNFCYSQIV